MAKIRIEPSKAKNVLDREQTLEKDLESLSSQVDSVRGRLRKSISGQEQIDARLKEAAEQLLLESQFTGSLRSGLEQIIARYQRAEDGNVERANPEGTSSGQDGLEGEGLQDLFSWDFLLPLLGPVQPVLEKLISVPPGPVTPFIPGILGTLDQILFDGEGSAALEEIQEKAADKIKDALGVQDLSDGYQKEYEKTFRQDKFYRDEDGNIHRVDPNDPEALAEFEKHNKGSVPVDMEFASIGAEGSVAFMEGGIHDRSEWGGYDVDYAIGQAEGHAEAYAGWGMAGVAAGGSITAFTSRESGYLGNDDAKLYFESTQTFGKASAEMSAQAGWLDEDGNFDPTLYAGGSAELVAAEITGKAGVDIGGVDVGVEGSAYVGIGAHANVGFQDGKLSVDIGAALGIGASVSFDVDFSGAIDAVAEKAEDLWSGLTGLFD